MNLMSKDAAEAAIPTEQEMASEKKSENSAPKLTLQEGAVSKKGSSLSLREKFRESAKEIKNPRTLTGVAMLLAMSVVLSFTASLRLSETLKIGLGYLITAILGMMYGPVTAAFAAGVGDIIKYLLKPTGGYFFGFTLTAMLGGVIYGIFFYKERCTVVRAIAAKTSVTVLLNCLLNTVWLSIMYGQPFVASLITRATKNIILLPFEIILLYVVLNGMSKVIQRVKHH